MNQFESWISRIEDKGKAISIHRDVLFAERFSEDDSPLYLLLNGRYYTLPHGNNVNDDAVIHHFRLDSDFADMYLQAVKSDGIQKEIALVSRWHKIAHALGPIRRRVLRKA